jgi:hypothetical protein
VRAVGFERPSGLWQVCWLADDGEWTRCGLRIEKLIALQLFELESLPSDQGCAVCEDTSEPRRGRLYTEGPTYHGPRSRDGGRQLRD